MPRMLAAAFVVLASSALLAQKPPSFKSGVNLVEVDVIVRDKDGHVVHDLGRGDFAVMEDGKPVDLETFTAVNLPPAPPAREIPPDTAFTAFGSNDFAQDGRLFLIVLDDFDTRFGMFSIQMTKRVAYRFIERLAPGDLAAVISTSSSSRMATEFTGDKLRLIQAVNAFFP